MTNTVLTVDAHPAIQDGEPAMLSRPPCDMVGGAGGVWWPKEATRRLRGLREEFADNNGFTAPLTRREGEVLKQAALGLTNRDIAAALGISYETAKEHVQKVLRKMGTNDRTQAAIWTARRGLV